MRLSEEKKLQSLLEKRTDLDAAIRKLQVKAAREHKQKLDKQGKLLGRAILDKIGKGQSVSFSSESEIKAFMDDHLVLKTERSAFDLPELDLQDSQESSKQMKRKTSRKKVTENQPEIATNTVAQDSDQKINNSANSTSIPDSKSLEDPTHLQAVEAVVSDSPNEQRLKTKPNVLTPLPMPNSQDDLAQDFFLDEDFSDRSSVSKGM